MLASTPTGEDKLRRFAVWEDDIFKAPTGMTRRFGELRLDKRQRGVVPRAHFQMERNAFGEIDHDADDGPIGGWTDPHGSHRRDLCVHDGRRNAEATESCRNEVRLAVRQTRDVSRR